MLVGCVLILGLSETHTLRSSWDNLAEVDSLATHGLSCRWSEGRHHRHAAMNDIVHRALASAKVPSRLEPSGLYCADGKRPDGITIVPWKCG